MWPRRHAWRLQISEVNVLTPAVSGFSGVLRCELAVYSLGLVMLDRRTRLVDACWSTGQLPKWRHVLYRRTLLVGRLRASPITNHRLKVCAFSSHMLWYRQPASKARD